MMAKFIKSLLLYLFSLAVLLTLALYLSSWYVESRNFAIYEAESNLFFIDKNQDYDLLFMGISHARNFSRSKNHIRLERDLGVKALNIGLGEGRCGVNEQHYYLEHFYRKGNRCNKVVYVISPPMFFSKELPVASNTFDREPFDLSFVFPYLFYPSINKKERIISYFRSKFESPWFEYRPWSLNANENSLDSINWKEVEKGERIVYGDSLDVNPFFTSKKRVEESIDLALEHESEVILMITPALFGKWKGHDLVTSFAMEMAKSPEVEFYDFSESIDDASLYYDHHHLNSKGMEVFIQEYFKPVL